MVAFLCFLCQISLWGQQEKSENAAPKDIFEALAIKKNGLGDIVINQPDAIKRLVGRSVRRNASVDDGDMTIGIVSGYRIQVYNGNLATSKQEAYRRAQIVSRAFSNVACYVSYRAPFWRLVVGDFLSQEEAQKVLSDMRRSIPDISGELYIVRDKIRVLH